MNRLKGIDLWDENRSKNLIPILYKFTHLPKIGVSEPYAIVIMALSVPDVIPQGLKVHGYFCLQCLFRAFGMVESRLSTLLVASYFIDLSRSSPIPLKDFLPLCDFS